METQLQPLHFQSALMAAFLPINSDIIAENSSLENIEGGLIPEGVKEDPEECCNLGREQ